MPIGDWKFRDLLPALGEHRLVGDRAVDFRLCSLNLWKTQEKTGRPLGRKKGLGIPQTAVSPTHEPGCPSHDCPSMTHCVVTAPSAETRGCVQSCPGRL